MDLWPDRWPTQSDEKRFGPTTTLYGTVALSFVIPPVPLRRVPWGAPWEQRTR